ncbi:MAG: SH3 domain-containing C40 family peptidase [Sediminicola sp.]
MCVCKSVRYGFLALLIFFVSCGTEREEIKTVRNEVERIQEKFAPDGRTALFAIWVKESAKGLILGGESTLPEAVAELRKNLKGLPISYTDSVQVLPSAELEGRKQGVITLSVANLRSTPAHSAELVTQAILGTPVKIYKKQGDWWYIQTPDKYLAWVDGAGLFPMEASRYDQWASAKKVIYTNTTGYSHILPDPSSQSVTDLVAGGVLELLEGDENFYKVGYPDGRVAYVAKSESQVFSEWLERLDISGTNLVTTSKKLMGLPYLWGGTSTKGVDCSGFTKTVYFLNGTVIPRDASQQISTGSMIDSIGDFKDLRAGDLLFFGRKATDSTKERVIHVGMWIGNNEFIHSAGDVHISSMDKEALNYDAFNHKRYLRTKRIIKEDDPDLIDLTTVPVFGGK